MSRISELSENRVAGETKVFAYGFDAAGFSTHHAPVSVPGIGRITFIDFYNPTGLDVADGVIVPQGIFEKIESQHTLYGPKMTVSVDKTFLLERERQVFNLLRAGKWVCFLVGEIVDELSQGLHLEPIADTDLCKRILNAFTVGRRRKYHIDAFREVKAREREFESYAHTYGIPTTVFEFPRLHPIERHVILEYGEQAVGIELDAQLFFLPFQAVKKDSHTAEAVATAVARAITQYRANRVVELPSWLEDLKFKNEDDLYLEINSLLEKLNRLESQLLSWKDYKSILVTSGSRLKNKIVAVLESVFDLTVEADKNRDSLIITDHHRRPIFMTAGKSTEKHVEKALVNEVHEQRKMAGLPDTMPAVLVVNSDTLIHDFNQRAQAAVPDEVVNRARSLNVLIVRTVDLLLLMREFEKDPHRRHKLMHLFLAGGGWLKIEPETFSRSSGKLFATLRE
ncbi:MAG: hypothetical protein ACM3TN_13205 [Alphaproteobacteria bacterium]